MIPPEDLVEEEWAEWDRLTPAENIDDPERVVGAGHLGSVK